MSSISTTPLLLIAAAPTAGGDPPAVAALCGALARLLLEEPDQDTLTAIRELPDRLTSTPQLQGIVAALAAAAESSAPEECRREFTRLFLDPRGAPCKPWESVWRENPPRLMGEAHGDVLAIYSEAGFQPRLSNDPADHIALELGFVALLASRIATARSFRRRATGEVKLLTRFVERHVQTWMPQFAEQHRQTARLPLYRSAGDLLAALVAS